MFQSRFKSSHDENLETFGDGAHVPGEPLNLPIVAFVATLKRASEFRKREALGGSWIRVHGSADFGSIARRRLLRRPPRP
jgi:hypothetical protein